jgi:glucans biosynthesis protein C
LEEGFAAWSRWAYLLFFLYGFGLASDERFGAALRRHTRLVAILGLLDRPRSGPPAGPATGRGRAGAVYAYLATAALPFYVLHQPIVVAVAYEVVPWDGPIIVEYSVIVALSLALTLAAYEFLVRGTRPTRFLFGMRPARRPVAMARD